MNRMISRHGWFALLGLAWLGSAGQGQAWERPPMKVNTVFQFDIEVRVGPDGSRPTAPWYTYFPADARMVPPPQMSPFPPFPNTFPPQAFPPAPQKQLRISNMPAAPMTTQLWPSQYGYGGSVQPVGYVPAQAPSYWYGNR
jgi:hypothetical protein